MRNSRWVSMVAGKNLKRAEEAAGSFSARTLGPRCVPRPRPLREKSTPSHPLHTLLTVLLVSLCRERSRLRILSSSARPRLLSHLSPQRGILRSEQYKERRLFALFRSGQRSRSICVNSTTTQQLNQLLQPHSPCVNSECLKRFSIYRGHYDRMKYRYGITTAISCGYFKRYILVLRLLSIK